MEISAKEIKAFQTKILSWYKKHKRDLPWRKTTDPYNILVSEIMLQQTQVSRVIPKYEAWLTKFSTVGSLAQASTTDVLGLWSGLGYNRRALYLKKCAQEVVAKYNGTFPSDLESLQKLPGIGDYTSRAVLSFAFNKHVAVVDTNTRKVISVEFFQGEPPAPKILQEIATQLLPKDRAKDWNQALMDYASAVLKKEKVPVVKQSRFIGSNRYYRGKLIKTLLVQKQLSLLAIAELFQKDSMFVEKVVEQLIKDGFVILEKKTVRLV